MVISLLILPAIGQNQSLSDIQIPFNDTLGGYRNEGQLYTWTLHNVSGTADCIYHYTVYASRLIGTNYTYHNREWNSWQVRDAAAGSQYLVVWVKGWLDEDSTTSWIGWGPDRFNAWIWGNRTIAPEPVHLEDLPISYRSEHFRPVLISSLFNRTLANGEQLTSNWYGWDLWNEQDRMVTGSSNAWDGIIIYQVPAAATLADIQIAGWFGYYGTAVWNLEPKEIEQDSLENKRLQEMELTSLQRVAGIRVSDRLSDRRKG